MDEVAFFARAFYRELELALGEEEAGAITVEVSSPVSSIQQSCRSVKSRTELLVVYPGCLSYLLPHCNQNNTKLQGFSYLCESSFGTPSCQKLSCKLEARALRLPYILFWSYARIWEFADASEGHLKIENGQVDFASHMNYSQGPAAVIPFPDFGECWVSLFALAGCKQAVANPWRFGKIQGSSNVCDLQSRTWQCKD